MPLPSPFAPAPPPFVVLKLDDMFATDGRVPDRWQRIADFSAQRRLKLSIGLICNSLDADQPDYLAGLRRLIDTGLIELWHHGYDHRRWDEAGVTYCEFSKTDRAHQHDHLVRAQQLAKDKLGLTFQTFGAPFNAIDATTAGVLATLPDIRVWLYVDPALAATAGKFAAVSPGPVNLEAPVHKPNYDAFVAALATVAPTHPRYLVLQGHPMSWDDTVFAEFVRIVDHLLALGCPFVLPAELPGLLK